LPKFRGVGRLTAVTSSDLAELSTLRAQVDDLLTRVVAIAERYDEGDDSSVATDLFNAERALVTARRSLERAVLDLER
jgi:hypothetical protein